MTLKHHKYLGCLQTSGIVAEVQDIFGIRGHGYVLFSLLLYHSLEHEDHAVQFRISHSTREASDSRRKLVLSCRLAETLALF